MFTEFQLNDLVLSNISKAGYVEPTPVQACAIQPALEGRNLIVTAETGSGKTAAFALPLITKSLSKDGKRSLSGLVLCPTREVAQQITIEVARLARGTGVRCLAVYGGVGIEPQIKQLRAGQHIVVATPGRLLDHVQRRTIDLSKVSTLVLDEADRMLDMGFLPDVQRIISCLPSSRQTLLYSATMPKEVLDLVERFVHDPLVVSPDYDSTPPDTLTQTVCPADPDQKIRMLVSFLKNESAQRTLVFAATKYRAERLAKQLAREGFRATFIHGGRSQNQRDNALSGFRRGEFDVLVGTDVAGRGVDVTGITHVVNYDLPADADSYIHRVGRTARAGKPGYAVSFVTKADRPVLRDIEMAIGCRLPLCDISLD